MSVVLAAVWISFFCCVAAVAMFWMEKRSEVRSTRHSVDPEQLLAERFARGEIDEREFAARQSALRIGPPLHAYLEP